MVSAVLSFIPQEALPFVVDLRLSGNLRGVTSRFSVGMHCESVLFGVIHMFIHPSGSGYFMVPFTIQ